MRLFKLASEISDYLKCEESDQIFSLDVNSADNQGNIKLFKVASEISDYLDWKAASDGAFPSDVNSASNETKITRKDLINEIFEIPDRSNEQIKEWQKKLSEATPKRRTELEDTICLAPEGPLHAERRAMQRTGSLIIGKAIHEDMKKAIVKITRDFPELLRMLPADDIFYCDVGSGLFAIMHIEKNMYGDANLKLRTFLLKGDRFENAFKLATALRAMNRKREELKKLI